ncbi:Barrier-to-autointegration factor B [Fasciola gigantica]|uniref:Barrier-to-autointegration factor-like protein n=1 Tax=Fasciola gigantica TaxID=46835 RepID=A0A504YU49_FASGI|nr:Barrier-to-autointegration factor B [Fasciola gigantica]
MSTSQKHRDFVTEPIGEKLVTDLPGIGEKLGERLEAKGFEKAYTVLGQFLLLRRDEELFKEWLKEACGANAKQAASVLNQTHWNLCSHPESAFHTSHC